MKFKLHLDNIDVFYQDHTGPKTSCLSFSFETEGLLPIHLYQQIGINSNLIDVSIILEVLKQRLTKQLTDYAARCCGRTFMGLFIFSVVFAGPMTTLKEIIDVIYIALTTPLKYLEYARICKAIKINYDPNHYKDALYKTEESIKKHIWMFITGKKVFQPTYKNGSSGSDKLKEMLTKNKTWTMPKIGPAHVDVPRQQTLWKPITKQFVHKIKAEYTQEWENCMTPVILYAILREKLTFPTSPEGYCPVVEPSGYFIYYRTRRTVDNWLFRKDMVEVAERFGAEKWFHWANVNALLLGKKYFTFSQAYNFRLPTIYEEIRQVCRVKRD